MEENHDMQSLKRNTDFLKKNNIDFFILDFKLEGSLLKDDYLRVWQSVKEKVPYNSFFLELGNGRAAVILPGQSPSEAERLLKEISETAALKVDKQFSIEGKVYKDITEDLDLEGTVSHTIANSESVPDEGPHHDEEKPSEAANKILRLSILDDDEVIRMFLGDQLDAADWGDWEIDLQVYREGESFFNSERLKETGKHIIVLDGIMPRMDGMEVLNEIRKQYNENEVSIIMLTSRNREHDIVSAFEAGAFDYVTKPFKINELIARIKRVAKRMESADA